MRVEVLGRGCTGSTMRLVVKERLIVASSILMWTRMMKLMSTMSTTYERCRQTAKNALETSFMSGVIAISRRRTDEAGTHSTLPLEPALQNDPTCLRRENMTASVRFIRRR